MNLLLVCYFTKKKVKSNVKLNNQGEMFEFPLDTGSSMTVINVKDLKYYKIEYFNKVEQCTFEDL